MTGTDQEAWAFRDEQQCDQKYPGGDQLHPEHAAPGFEAEPQWRRGAARDIGEDVVVEEREEQAADDRHLLDRRQSAAQMRGSDLADIGR
jgi:hypothetical protein